MLLKEEFKLIIKNIDNIKNDIYEKKHKTDPKAIKQIADLDLLQYALKASKKYYKEIFFFEIPQETKKDIIKRIKKYHIKEEIKNGREIHQITTTRFLVFKNLKKQAFNYSLDYLMNNSNLIDEGLNEGTK